MFATTLNDPNSQTPKVSGTVSKYCSTRTLLPSPEYKRHKKVMSKISSLKADCRIPEIDYLRQVYATGELEDICRDLSELPEHIVQMEARYVSQRKRRQWTNEDKAFALSLHERSSKLYRYLTTQFCLPDLPTLLNLLMKVRLNCGITELYLNCLEMEVKNLKDNNCTLMFNDMGLNSSEKVICGVEDYGHLGRTTQKAERVLIFMIRGLYCKWKEIVAHYFTKSDFSGEILKQIIIEIICKLQSIGLNVRTIVCDQTRTTREAIALLTNNNYFTINNHRIFIIYDVPHLLKLTRNVLLLNNIQFDECISAKYENIFKAHCFDVTDNSNKICRKLTRRHFDFQSPYSMNKVSYAAQQFSSTMSTCILNFIRRKLLPHDAIYTSEFVHLINSLFDSLNGYYINTDPTKVCEDLKIELDEHGIGFKNLHLRFAITNTSNHLKFWENILKIIKTWKLIDYVTDEDVTNNYSFNEGWETTIKSVMGLWTELKSEGFPYLSTRLLNLDPLENLFSQVRQHGYFETNPTYLEFVDAFKIVILNKLSLPVIIDHQITEPDEATYLDVFSKFSNEFY